MVTEPLLGPALVVGGAENALVLDGADPPLTVDAAELASVSTHDPDCFAAVARPLQRRRFEA